MNRQQWMAGRGIRVATAGALVALTVTGCALGSPIRTSGTIAPPSVTPSSEPSQPEPSPSAPATTSAAPSPSATESEPPATSPAAATGTGEMLLYANLVSDAFVATCADQDGRPTITMADHSNDFFNTVDVTVVLTRGAAGVASIAVEFGEDSEGILRKLAYQPGTAKLTVTGSTYRIKGEAMMYEDEAAAGLTPYTISAECPGTF